MKKPHMSVKNIILNFTYVLLLLVVSLTTLKCVTPVLSQNNTLIEKEDTSQSGNQPLQIIKVAKNSYTITLDASFIGSFNTTYQIGGDVGSMNESKDLIITTITKDFDSSPEAGYVNNTSSISDYQINPNKRNLSNPFAPKDVIDEKIKSEIAASIENAEKSGIVHGEIECIFGSSLDDFKCSFRD
jgi:hypothetical protein